MNTYLSDIVSDDQVYQRLILSNPQIELYEPQPLDIKSDLDGILNLEKSLNYKACQERQFKTRQYFSDEHFQQKNIKFSYFGFRFENGKVLWGITQFLNSCLVELSLNKKLSDDSNLWGLKYVQKSRVYDWNIDNDTVLNDFLRLKSKERVDSLCMENFK